MDSLAGYVATVVVSLIVGYLMHWVEPKSRIQAWSPHNFWFDLGDNSTIQTNSVAIHNSGRRPARDIEVVHASRPDFIQFWPTIPYSEETTARGEHVIRVASLGPKEAVFLQLLGSPTLPDFRNLRWEGGQAQWIPMQAQRVWPNWAVRGAQVVLLVGLASIAYWLIRLGLVLLGRVG